MAVTLLHGDCRRVLPMLPKEQFRACVTSVPYFEQREYLPKDHPDKALEIGHEATPSSYVEALVVVFREVRRVLAPDGTLWINIGDKYANDEKWGGSTSGRHAKHNHGPAHTTGGTVRRRLKTGLPPKSLIGIPWRLAFALQEDGWILRAENIWAKASILPEGNVRDRPTRSHEHVFLFSKQPTYYYDVDAVRQPHQMRPQRRPNGHKPLAKPGQPDQTWNTTARTDLGVDGHPLGRNLRTVWDDINTEPGDGEHAAPMPRTLARRCILAGTALGDHVLDPFGGQGTVGRVAEAEGRHATLIDLDERAVEMARTATAQTGLFASPAPTSGQDARARAAARAAVREALLSLPKPEKVKRGTLWRFKDEEFVFVDRVMAPGPNDHGRKYVDFTNGSQVYADSLLSDFRWVYFGPGPDPERDLDPSPQSADATTEAP